MTRRTVSLRDVTSLITKGTTPTSIGLDFTHAGVPFLRVENLLGGRIDFSQGTRYVSNSTHQVLRRSAVQPGDVLVSIAGTIGRAALVHQDLPEMNCNQAVAIIRPTDSLYAPYLMHWLQSSTALGQIGQSKVTATISNLSLSQLSELRILLPPVQEQRRIAAILDRADDLRQKRRAALQKLDSFTQSIFLDMFGDPISNPKKWKRSLLGDVCDRLTDGTHFSPPIQAAGIPYITAKHLKATGLDFFSDPWYVSQADHDNIYQRCDPRLGDVLYIKDGATTGIAAINPYDFPFSMLSSLALIRPSPKLCLSQYLCAYLNEPRVKTIMLGDMAGAAIRRLTLEKLRRAPVLLPPIDLQEEFSGILVALQESRANADRSLTGLDSAFLSLQHRAFKGEV